MSKTWKRILLFFIGIPALTSIILFMPQLNHLAINIVAVAVCVVGAYEFRGFFMHAGLPAGNPLAPLLAGLLPVATYFEITGILEGQLLFVTLIFSLLVLLTARLSNGGEGTYDAILPDLAASFAVLIYPSLFLSYFIRLSSLPNASFVILTFLIVVFANDTGAYFFGSLVGGKSRGVTKISPEKSLVGFISGWLCSVVFALLCNALFKGVFGSDSSWIVAAIVGALVGVVSIIGDLVESALKRSARLKDSGSIIPGRGGVLDSVDSILFAAPVFFYLLHITL